MRSSKSRSRSKSGRNNNNNRSAGNLVNRVFDSSGPEGKVRGTPQQIIEKYNQLARDAQLSNDRVATENFQQHAEHYLRILSAATREQEAKREQQERENRERQAKMDRENANRPPREKREHQQPQGDQPQQQQNQHQSNDPSQTPQPDIVEIKQGGEESGLVDTPESASADVPTDAPAPKPKRTYTRKPKPPKPDAAE